MKRHVALKVEMSVKVGSHLKTHSKHRFGGKKVLREVIAGDEFWRKGRVWTYLYRLFDRVNDWYEERVVSRGSPGHILHQKAHKLSEHDLMKRESGLLPPTKRPPAPLA